MPGGGGGRGAVVLIGGAIALAGIISPVLWVPVSKATSKRTVWMAGCVLASAALFAIWLQPALPLWPRTILFLLAGVGIHAVLMTFFAAVADAADYGEWKSGVRVEALLFGCVAFANKVSLGLGAWMLGLGLDASGYRSGGSVAAQPPAALEAITLWMTLVPTAGFMLSAAIVYFFPVSNAVHASVQADLAARAQSPGR
jgi:GPH family glycoside/pentoside/hexuronide:cation symporter